MNDSTDDALALLTRHGERLHALLTRLTLRADVAEDLMQDLFCKLSQSRRFQTAQNKLAYAIRTSTNLAFDYRRTQRRLTYEPLDPDELMVSGATPVAISIRREELDHLLDTIGRLTRGNRTLIVLRYIEQQDYADIARELGKTQHQVRALCHKAIHKLRALYDSGLGSGRAKA